MDGFIYTLNSWAWVLSNIEVAYIALALLIFVVAYFILFNPSLTTAGKYIFRFFVSLIAIIGLVFIGVFIDPTQHRHWAEFPGDVIWWRPLVRLIGYGYVAFTITSLAILLIVRKWFPDKLRTKTDHELLKTRDHFISLQKEKKDDSTKTSSK